MLLVMIQKKVLFLLRKNVRNAMVIELTIEKSHASVTATLIACKHTQMQLIKISSEKLRRMKRDLPTACRGFNQTKGRRLFFRPTSV